MPIQTPICDFGQKAIPFELKSTENKILSLDDIKGENGTLIMSVSYTHLTLPTTPYV